MRLLTFSSLFPSSARPVHGVFVENRLQHLKSHSGVEVKVVAPVPFFPSQNQRFGPYAAMARTPKFEMRSGIEVYHPRFLTIPKFGMALAPALLYLGARSCVRRLIAQGYDFDVIDAHYFYPDGVAAALLAREFDKPLTITARGTDLNLIPQYRLPRKQILWAADRADRLITVCQALKDVLKTFDVPDAKTVVLRNGVDLTVFHPAARDVCRAKLGLTRFTVLSVGHLVERKGHHLIIDALGDLPDTDLVIAGDGPMRQSLEARAQQAGVSDRVIFLGAVDHRQLYEVYSAADLLILASDREGWPNVLLEAMACGTPVVATDVWGASEVIRSPAAGRLAAHRDAACLTRTIGELRADMPDRAATRAYAEQFSWDETSAGQVAVFQAIVASGEHQITFPVR